MSPERTLERAVVAFCKQERLVTYKFTSPAMKGVPDRIIIGTGGVLFMELKAPGNRPTKLQKWHLDRIAMAGGEAVWCDNIETAKEIIIAVCT